MIMQTAGVVDASAFVAHPRLESGSECRADAMVHVIGVTCLAACVALALIALPGADPAVVVSLVVYGAGLLAMLGCSALCNTAGPGPLTALWRRLDHAAIFVMIAGTYTPFAAIAIGGVWGTGLLVFVGTVAAAGVVLKLLHPKRLETLSIAAYLLLGWTILVAIDHLIAAVSMPAFVLLAAGGVL
jgi:hemolysin III